MGVVPGHGKRNQNRRPRGFNKGRSSKFREGSRVRQTPEEGRRTYWPKRCGNNYKDEEIVRKTLMIKKTHRFMYMGGYASQRMVNLKKLRFKAIP